MPLGGGGTHGCWGDSVSRGVRGRCGPRAKCEACCGGGGCWSEIKCEAAAPGSAPCCCGAPPPREYSLPLMNIHHPARRGSTFSLVGAGRGGEGRGGGAPVTQGGGGPRRAGQWGAAAWGRGRGQGFVRIQDGGSAGVVRARLGRAPPPRGGGQLSGPPIPPTAPPILGAPLPAIPHPAPHRSPPSLGVPQIPKGGHCPPRSLAGSWGGPKTPGGKGRTLPPTPCCRRRDLCPPGRSCLGWGGRWFRGGPC